MSFWSNSSLRNDKSTTVWCGGIFLQYVHRIYWKKASKQQKKRRFYDILDCMIPFNPYPGLVIASLDKMVYDDYFCLVASKKHQIYERKRKTSIRKPGIRSISKR